MIKRIKRVSYVSVITSFFLIYSCQNSVKMLDNWEGKVVYKINSAFINPDASDSTNFQIVYAKDSMLRVESFTPIGKQVYIKHIPKNKAYILMDIHSDKIAIQTYREDAPNKGKYKFNEVRGRKKFGGRKAKNIDVQLPEIDTTMRMNYFEEIPEKYSEAIPGIPGFPANYTVYSNGDFITYQVIEIDEKELDIDLFGIPANYTKISMDQFIEMIEQ